MEEMDRDRLLAQALAERCASLGGRAYYVGGCVRDEFLGIESKDVDVEVHGLSPEQLEAVLEQLGSFITVGRSFGVYSIRGFGLDIAMPRKERAVGRGHRDFTVNVDPFIGPEKAALRRDFTVNAMMKDVLTGDLTDPFGGRTDLENRILRCVSAETFPEDPLRVLRAAQMAARFGMSVEPETEELCRSIPLDALSPERVMEELKKALLKAPKPSVFFRVLRSMDALDRWFPEVRDLIGVPQRADRHREGDVWEHTLMVLDEAAAFRGSTEDDLVLMLAALTHDMGKPCCSRTEDGIVHAYGHEKAGLAPAKEFLTRLTSEKHLIRLVLNLTELHMKPNAEAEANVPVKTTNRMFDRCLAPEALLALAAADDRGRITDGPLTDHEPFLRERLEIYRTVMSDPYVKGEDLIRAGLTPGPAFTEALAYAHRLRLAGIGREDALRQTLGHIGAGNRKEDS